MLSLCELSACKIMAVEPLSCSVPEAAARTAARMSRSAAQAFEDEAHVLKDQMEILQTWAGP